MTAPMSRKPTKTLKTLHHTSAPREFKTYLRYEDVFGRKPTRDNLAGFVGRLPCPDLVTRCAAISALSRGSIDDPKHHSDLLRNLLASKPTNAQKIAALLAEPGMNRVLFTDETLLAVIRMAIAEDANPGVAVSDHDFSDNFLRAALAVNQFLSDELLPPSVMHRATDLLPSELRSSLLQLTNPHVLLARSDAFFTWSASDRGSKHADAYLPIEEDLLGFTGLGHMDFAAGAYAVFARLASARSFDEAMKIGVVFDPDAWLSGVRDSRVPRTWLDVSSIPSGAIRAEWQAQPSLSYAGAGSLFRRPVMTVENGLCIVPSPSLVLNAMGDGTYFALLDNYDDTRRQMFSRHYGYFFEDYVVDILERAFAPRGAIFKRATMYRPGSESSDAFIADGGDVLFVEVVAKRMNLVKSILQLDAEQIARDIEQGVLKKMRQLHKNVEEFRSGALFPEVRRFDGQRIFPILVSPKAFPRMYLIDGPLKNTQEREGLLATTEPIELLTIDELESIESDLAAGLNLGDLLHRKNCSTPQNRFSTMNNYLIFTEPRAAMRENRAQQRGNDTARRLIEVVESWGLPRLNA